MRHHRAYGVPLESLDVAVVDDHRPMQSILRSILLGAHVARVRAFDSAREALIAMAVDPPDLVIADWRMAPTSGLTLVKAMRRPSSGALATVPVVMITASPTRALIERAVRLGIHSVLVKPLSPATLMTRIAAILADGRRFEVDADSGFYRLEDAGSVLRAQHGRWAEIRGLRQDPSDLVLDRPDGSPERGSDMPFLPNPVPIRIPTEVYGAEPEPAPAGRSGFAAVKRGIRPPSTGQGGSERP
ncbi:response regulator [Prosthecomicrobium sp. N25]|uniref:response regulator n=1 Tax=Prosthecomicrobium sp. N25 TaxID=3129254 RepID=UPI0030770DFC